MAAIHFDLPAINGVYEAGIAVGVDPTLEDRLKLPILLESTISRAAGYAGAWAYTTFAAVSPRLRQIYCSAAEACVLAGLCVPIGDIIDGDWRALNAQDPTVVEKCPDNCHTPANLMDALTFIIASKANWYMMNHHTGQGGLQGYIRKVVLVKFPDLRENDNDVVTCIHTIGHWASTIKVMALAGLPHIRIPGAPVYAPSINVELSPDAKLRFSGMPAGTHKLGVAFEGAKRLVKSVFIKLCPDAEELLVLPPRVKEVLNARASHHFGASYLTGRARASFDDTEHESYLGRIGTYVRMMIPSSTLAQSPHIAEGKVQTYPDFSSEFQTAFEF